MLRAVFNRSGALRIAGSSSSGGTNVRSSLLVRWASSPKPEQKSAAPEARVVEPLASQANMGDPQQQHEEASSQQQMKKGAGGVPPSSQEQLVADQANVNVPTHPVISVVGVGGAGGNTVNNMVARHFKGVEFVVANTDGQALAHSLAKKKVQLGRELTHGLGAGAKPAVGRDAAVEGLETTMAELKGSHMVFVTAGMGGGTGTGAAPVIAQAARDAGALTVGIVTKPFAFEGRTRMRLAEEGIKELEQAVDTLIVIPNQKLLMFGEDNIGFADAFSMVDNVLYEGVKGVTDLIVMPGLINLDFADVKSIMQNMGRALMGTGEAEGRGRARVAAEMALFNPLLEDVSVAGATGVLISIQGGADLTLSEVDEIANTISSSVDEDANIIFGSSFDESLVGKVRVSVIITGMDGAARAAAASSGKSSEGALDLDLDLNEDAAAEDGQNKKKKKKGSWW